MSREPIDSFPIQRAVKRTQMTEFSARAYFVELLQEYCPEVLRSLWEGPFLLWCDQTPELDVDQPFLPGDPRILSEFERIAIFQLSNKHLDVELRTSLETFYRVHNLLSPWLRQWTTNTMVFRRYRLVRRHVPKGRYSG